VTRRSNLKWDSTIKCVHFFFGMDRWRRATEPPQDGAQGCADPLPDPGCASNQLGPVHHNNFARTRPTTGLCYSTIMACSHTGTSYGYGPPITNTGGRSGPKLNHDSRPEPKPPERCELGSNVPNQLEPYYQKHDNDKQKDLHAKVSIESRLTVRFLVAHRPLPTM
jgi:hypothetical protein